MKNIRSFLLTVAVVILSLPQLSAQKSPTQEQVDKRMHQILNEANAIGLAVAVVKDNKIVFTNTYGKKDRLKGGEIKVDDLFRIASISKSFTATAIMTLLEEGKLSLDDSVSDILGFPVVNPHYPNITITLRMLLSHVSSINDSQTYKSLDIINPATNPDWEKCYSKTKPGEDYKYSNLGFNMVGTIVEKCSGVRFDIFLRDRIFRPMGLYGGHNVDSLDASKFVPLYYYRKADPSKGTKNRFIKSSLSYKSVGEEVATNYKMGYSAPIFSPTGGVKISVVDLARYMMMHMNYGKDIINDKRIISEENAKLMQSPIAKVNKSRWYGMGLSLRSVVPGRKFVGHTGSAYGLKSAIYFDPEEKFGFVVITNGYITPTQGGPIEILNETTKALYNLFIK